MSLKKTKAFGIIFTKLFIFCQNSLAAFVIHPSPSAAEYGNVTQSDYLKASVFIHLSAKEFASVTGQKLNFLQRLYFKSVQRKLKTEVFILWFGFLFIF